MTKEQTIEQLKSLKADRESFIQNEGEHDKVFLEDIKAIETVLSMLEEKDKVIDLILDKFIDGTGYYFSEFDYMNEEEIKQYFENKVRQKD